MKLYALLVCLLSLIFGLNASPASIDRIGGRIIGGEAARTNQFPFAAAIYSTSSVGTFFCSGAVVSNQWILTAAQCIIGATQFTLYLGSTILQGSDPNRVTLATASSVVHPDYNAESFENDIGLIRLRLSIEFNEYVSAINLPVLPLNESALVTAIGWGHNSDNIAGLSNSLQYVQLTTLANHECQSIYGSLVQEDFVCAVGALNEGICTGDSGGALIEYRTAAIAVHVAVAVFHSMEGCENTHPSGYTRTYPYVDWIKNVTGIN